MILKVELVQRWRVLTVMTNDNASAPTADAEQRIDRAVDAIRSMSQDLADEVAPRPGLLDRLSEAARAAPPIPSLAIAFLIGFIVAQR